jgi:hypothetical protein
MASQHAALLIASCCQSQAQSAGGLCCRMCLIEVVTDKDDCSKELLEVRRMTLLLLSAVNTCVCL